MSLKFTVTVTPVTRPELEYVHVFEDEEQVDEAALEQLAIDARQRWWDEMGPQVQLHVAFERNKAAGRYGSGNDELDVNAILAQTYGGDE
jgi:hypothetical protein